MDLTILIPAHNEEENIGLTIRRLEATLKTPHKILVVNDHSSDHTQDEVEKLLSRFPDIGIVENTNPPGFGNCVRAGFSQVETEFLALVMADLCDEPDSIDEMYRKINSGFDIICGSRYSYGGVRLGGSRQKGFFSWSVSKSLHLIISIPTCDVANAFKMYRKNVLENLNIESKGFEISMEIPLKAYFRGYKIGEVPTVWEERTQGRSSFKMWRELPQYLRWYLWAIGKRVIYIFS